MQLIDLRHLGRQRVIGSWLVADTLVDPGPESCIETLLQGLDGQVPKRIALTHIHLDHAGATGALLQRFASIEVWVHERGAKHLVDPSKLLASAGRLYGDEMQRLWGEVLPVPAERIRTLSGGEEIDGFSVAYTPGHASHHVSYLHRESSTVFCGDVAGVRVVEGGPVLAPTPPPDVDLPLWRGSLDQIESWQPRALAPTHFGLYRDVEEHLRQIRGCLTDFERLAREGDEGAFVAAIEQRVEAGAGEAVGAYKQAMPPDQSFAGLRRYVERS